MTSNTGTARFMSMKGAGYYSRSTQGAKDVIDSATPLILEALASVEPENGAGVFRAADFGAADGGTSLDMWRQALAKLRRAAPNRPIELIYTDLPGNDFSQLFRTVHGQTEARTFLTEVDDVFVVASGTSFHDAVLPQSSLHFGFSANASHYIVETPCEISDHVHMVGARGAERAAYEEQGRRDWERFLLARAHELAPGGRLVLINFGIDEVGRYLGSTEGVSMFDSFARLWRGLAEEGVITQREFAATNFPQCYRTLEQFVAPFEDPGSSVRRAGLRLERADTRIAVCPYARDFERRGDATAFADAYLPTLRSWSEAVFLRGLDPKRSAEERVGIVDEFYRRYRDEVIAAPREHRMDYVHAYLICAKQG
jgi:hypothetical protein